MTMDERRESGFINSQPCIAEFMTSLPLINETLQPPSITTEGNSRSYCQQFTPNHPSLSQHADPRGPGIVDPRGRDSGTGKYPEFAWMKEKKNIRKNSNSSVPVSTGSDIGNYTSHFFLFHSNLLVLISTNWRCLWHSPWNPIPWRGKVIWLDIKH